jgi:putative sigma-54 modulation protein
VRILIHPRTITADAALRSQVAEVVEAGLGSLLSRLQWVDAYLTDVNGPRGGPDKRCRVVAHVATGPIVVEQIGRDPVVVAAKAAARCRRLILARLKRNRDRRRRAAA